MEHKEIGKYRITRELGVGGMGIVYQGLDPVSQAHVAIKVLPPSMVDRATVERFSREVTAMTRLSHPHIVKVMESGMMGGRHFYIMEFVPGETIKGILKKVGKIPQKDVLRIMAQITDAVNYIHLQGMIHRDIKPANIMLSSNGQAKLMDFGLVQIPGLTKITMENSMVGTAEYMSPEQIEDKGVDSRSDIYALGVTMYEMLCGRPPFKADSVQAILLKHQNEKPVPLGSIAPEVSAETQEVVAKAIEKDVAARYQKAQDMLLDLRRIAEKKSLSPAYSAAVPSPADLAQDQGQTEPAEKPGTRKTKGVLKYAVILLVLLGWGVIFREEILTGLEKVLPILKDRGAFMSPKDHGTEDYLRILEQAEQHDAQGRKYAAQNQWDAAAEEFKKALALCPDHAEYYRHLAELYERNNDVAQAVQSWQLLLKYIPSGPNADLAQRRIKELLR